jgi:hypothetical protein
MDRNVFFIDAENPTSAECDRDDRNQQNDEALQQIGEPERHVTLQERWAARTVSSA